jgi:hypothetical protein
LTPKRDVPLLVAGDVPDPLAESGQQVAASQPLLDEVLARLGQRRLDHEVIKRDRLRQLRPRVVAPELVGHPVQPLEHLPEAPRQSRPGRVQGGPDIGARARDLAHEPREQHGVPRLVDVLGGEEVLLLFARGRVNERRQVVGYRVLAVEEQGVRPQRAPALDLGELLLPLVTIKREVDLGGAPVALLPAGIQVGVRNLVGGDRRRHPSPV